MCGASFDPECTGLRYPYRRTFRAAQSITSDELLYAVAVVGTFSYIRVVWRLESLPLAVPFSIVFFLYPVVDFILVVAGNVVVAKCERNCICLRLPFDNVRRELQR